MSHAHQLTVPSGFPDTPIVPEIPDSSRHLGLELSATGCWGRPAEALRLWQWLRDQRAEGARPLDGWAAWFGQFLGLGDGDDPVTLARWLALGFRQGICCARAGVSVPQDFAADLPEGLAEAGLDPVAGLRWAPDTDPLLGFQRWAADWIGRTGVRPEPVEAWKAGAVLGGRWMRRDALVCGAVLAWVDQAGWAERYAAPALASQMQRPQDNPWQVLVRSTYPRGCPEGEALAASAGRGLKRARYSAGRLREFLLDAVREGFHLARTDPGRARRISLVPGLEKRRALARMYEHHAGSLKHPADPDHLLERMAGWLRWAHPTLLDSARWCDGVLLLRYAYDYLWWRGLLEGLAQR
ncbi:MAG: hypothetical protein ACKO3N_17705, partial [Verrucomicrobiota bacterium]